MHGSKPVKVPIPIGVKLSADKYPKTWEEEEDMSHVPYASAVGSLMYAMVCTRLNIAHLVGVLRRYCLHTLLIGGGVVSLGSGILVKKMKEEGSKKPSNVFILSQAMICHFGAHAVPIILSAPYHQHPRLPAKPSLQASSKAL
jgi:hypothetical protein